MNFSLIKERPKNNIGEGVVKNHFTSLVIIKFVLIYFLDVLNSLVFIT